MFFINCEEQAIIYQVHVLALFLQVKVLRFLKDYPVTFFTEVFDECLHFRQTTVRAQQVETTVFGITFCHEFARCRKFFLHNFTLCAHQFFNVGLQLIKLMSVSLGCWSGNNQWGSCVINQYRVYLIHNGVVMAALYQVFRRASHIVTQVIKAKLIVCTIGDIAQVGLPSIFAIGLMLVYTINGQPMKIKDRPHPLGISSGKIIVNRNHVYTFSGQGIQVNRERCHQGFTFTRGHLSNFTLV